MINYTYHCKFNSQEDKYIAENCLPIGKAELYGNPKNKKKKKGWARQCRLQDSEKEKSKILCWTTAS